MSTRCFFLIFLLVGGLLHPGIAFAQWDDFENDEEEMNSEPAVSFKAPKFKEYPDSGLSGKRKKWNVIGKSYNQLFSVTSKEQLLEAFSICRFISKQAKKAELWTLIPRFPYNERKDKNLLMENPFLNLMIESNVRLQEALSTQDPVQKLENLKIAYYDNKFHFPTVWALIECLWENGYDYAGDQLLFQVSRLEPEEFHWQTLYLEAKKDLRNGNYDHAMERFSKMRRIHPRCEPVVQGESEKWREKMLAASGDPQSLLEMGALKALEAQTADSIEAMLLYSTVAPSPNNTKLLAKALKMEPNNIKVVKAYLSAERFSPLSKGKIKKALKGVSSSHANDPVVQYFSLPEGLTQREIYEATKAIVQQAPENDLVFNRFYTSALLMEKKAYEAMNQAFKLRLEKKPSAKELLKHYSYQASMGKGLESLQTLDRVLNLDPYYIKAFRQLKKQLPDTPASGSLWDDVRKWAAYRAITGGLKQIEEFDFDSGLDLLEQSASLFPERAAELNLISGNYMYSLGMEKRALPNFEKAIQDFPEKPYLYEILGDCYLANDLTTKSINAFSESLRLDPDRSGIEDKMSKAKRRKGQKVGEGFLTVLAVASFAAGAAGGGMVHFTMPNFYYEKNYQRYNLALKTLSTQGFQLFSMSENMVESPVGQSEELLMDFYHDYLDLEEAYEGVALSSLSKVKPTL